MICLWFFPPELSCSSKLLPGNKQHYDDPDEHHHPLILIISLWTPHAKSTFLPDWPNAHPSWKDSPTPVHSTHFSVLLFIIILSCYSAINADPILRSRFPNSSIPTGHRSKNQLQVCRALVLLSCRRNASVHLDFWTGATKWLQTTDRSCKWWWWRWWEWKIDEWIRWRA